MHGMLEDHLPSSLIHKERFLRQTNKQTTTRLPIMKNAEAKKMTKNLGAKNISKNAKRILREAV